MMSGVIRGQNCSLEVLIILASGFDSLAKYKTLETRRNGGSGEGFFKLPKLKTATNFESFY